MNNNFLVTVLRKFENRKIVRKLRKRIYFQNTDVERLSGRFYKPLRNFFLRIKRFILNTNVMVIRVTEYI